MSRKITKTIHTEKIQAPHGLSKQELLQLRDAFNLLDPNNSGIVEVAQLQNLISTAGVASKSLQIALSQAALVSKSIDFPGFVQVFTAHAYSPRCRAALSQVFRLLDDQNAGYITAKNIRRAVFQLQMNVSQAQIQEMVDKADRNNDGVIDQEEFYLIMTKISSKV